MTLSASCFNNKCALVQVPTQTRVPCHHPASQLQQTSSFTGPAPNRTSSIATVRFHAIRVRMNHRTGSTTCFSPCVLRRPMRDTHGRAGAVNTQQPSCQAEKGLSVSPWQPSSASTPRPRPFPPLAFTDEKVNKMVERIKVTWLLCAFGRDWKRNYPAQHGLRIKYPTVASQ